MFDRKAIQITRIDDGGVGKTALGIRPGGSVEANLREGTLGEDTGRRRSQGQFAV